MLLLGWQSQGWYPVIVLGGGLHHWAAAKRLAVGTICMKDHTAEPPPCLLGPWPQPNLRSLPLHFEGLWSWWCQEASRARLLTRGLGQGRLCWSQGPVIKSHICLRTQHGVPLSLCLSCSLSPNKWNLRGKKRSRAGDRSEDGARALGSESSGHWLGNWPYTYRCAWVCLHQFGSCHNWLDHLRALLSTTQGLQEALQASGCSGKAVWTYAPGIQEMFSSRTPTSEN